MDDRPSQPLVGASCVHHRSVQYVDQLMVHNNPELCLGHGGSFHIYHQLVVDPSCCGRSTVGRKSYNFQICHQDSCWHGKVHFVGGHVGRWSTLGEGFAGSRGRFVFSRHMGKGNRGETSLMGRNRRMWKDCYGEIQHWVPFLCFGCRGW